MRAVAAAVALALLAASAHAVTLYTTTAQVTTASSALLCKVNNVGPSPVTVAVALANFDGVPVTGENTCVTTYSGTLPAGASCFVRLWGPTGNIRCTVDASSSKIRAGIEVLNGAGDSVLDVPATKK